MFWVQLGNTQQVEGMASFWFDPDRQLMEQRSIESIPSDTSGHDPWLSARECQSIDGISHKEVCRTGEMKRSHPLRQ